MKVVFGVCCALIGQSHSSGGRIGSKIERAVNSFSPDFQVSGTCERHVTRYDLPMYRAIGRLRADESYRVAAPLERWTGDRIGLGSSPAAATYSLRNFSNSVYPSVFRRIY